MEKSQEEHYQERMKRIEDAVQLKIPDRVPTLVDFGYYAAKYAGITCEDALYDYDKWAEANKKIVLDFKPDVHHSILYFSGPAFEALDLKVFKWPGHGLPPNQSYQYIEGEYMKADEYDHLIHDTADFIIRRFLPRTVGVMASVQNFPHLSSFAGLTMGFVPPNVLFQNFIDACGAIYKAGKETMKCMFETRMNHVNKMDALGFPSIYQVGLGMHPFEQISYSYRGMKGAMMDMYRRPDKLLEASKKLMDISIESLVYLRPMGKNNLCWTGSLRGGDCFMSPEQFKKFYWPDMKTLYLAYIEKGFTPVIFWEGDVESRLEYFLELPKGKVIHRFDRTDMFKAKEVLGGHHCIAGGIPSSLLATGTVQDVKDRCKVLIDTIGKDGGYILSHSCQMDDLKPENMKTIIDFPKEYGLH